MIYLSTMKINFIVIRVQDQVGSSDARSLWCLWSGAGPVIRGISTRRNCKGPCRGGGIWRKNITAKRAERANWQKCSSLPTPGKNCLYTCHLRQI